MFKRKQVKENNMWKLEHAHSISKQLEFENLGQCTDYFYNEIGKLNTIYKKTMGNKISQNKRFYKNMYKLLYNSCYANADCQLSIEKIVRDEVKKQLKSSPTPTTTHGISQKPTPPQAQITNTTTKQLPSIVDIVVGNEIDI